MRKTQGLQWIFIFFFALALTWVFILPPFQGADESVHFSQSKLWSSVLSTGFEFTPTLQGECREDLFTLLKEHRAASLRFNPLSSYAASLTEDRHSYEYLYDFGCDQLIPFPFSYLINGIFLLLLPDNLNVQFYALRILSLVFFVGTLFLLHRTAKCLFSTHAEQFLFVALTGLQPIFIVSNISVSYDGLNNFLFAAGFALSTGWLTDIHFPLRRYLLWSTVLSGAALLTKASGIFLAFFLLLSLLHSRRVKIRVVLLWALLMLVPAFWVLFAKAHYTPNGLQSLPIDSLSSVYNFLFSLFVERWALLFESFWGGGDFGWLDVHVHPLFLALIFLFCCGGIVGALVALYRAERRTPGASLLTYFFLCLLFFEAVATLYNLPLVSSIEIFGYIQGRYYFPLVIPLFYLLIQGWKTWIPPRRFQHFSIFLIFFFLIYHFIYLTGTVLPRFYF